MERGGSEYSKLRLRFYEATHRGVHAACNIMLGDTILQIPQECIITIHDCKTTPVGKQMFEAGLFNDEHYNNLYYGYHNHMAVYLLTEI